MTVTLRCYGGLREVVGAREVVVDLPTDAVAGDALVAAIETASGGPPAHLPDLDSLVWRRDGEAIAADTPVADGESISVTDVTMPE